MDDVDRLLEHLGIERTAIDPDLDGLVRIQRSALRRLPLHDLHVLDGTAPTPCLAAAIAAAADGRGNWRFGANLALGGLLRTVGYEVAFSGAALLLDGPNRTIDHIVLEVSGRDLAPHLVDVGLATSPIGPVRLNTYAEQRVGPDLVQLLSSPHGTTLATVDEGVPAAILRFRRVAHDIDDFAATIATERRRHRAAAIGPTVTRLLDHRTGDRVTITDDAIEIGSPRSPSRRRDIVLTQELEQWFPTLAAT